MACTEPSQYRTADECSGVASSLIPPGGPPPEARGDANIRTVRRAGIEAAPGADGPFDPSGEQLLQSQPSAVDNPTMGQGTGLGLPAGLLALAADPRAVCITIDGQGASTVPPPEGLADLFTIVEPPGSPLDALHPGSQAAAVSLFEMARCHGEAHGDVRAAASPDGVHHLHIFDLRSEHGCLVTVLVPTSADGTVNAADPATLPPPRRMELKLNASGVIVEVDDASAAVLGWCREDMVGRPALGFIEPSDHGRSIAFWADVLSQPGASRRLRQQWLRRDGSRVWVETTETNMLDSDGWVSAELVDISDEMAAQIALRDREELLVRLTHALPTGVLQIDGSGDVAFSNPRWFEITDLHQGASVADFVTLCSGRDRTRLTRAIERTRETGGDCELVVNIHTTTDHRRVCRLRLCALEGGSSVLVCLDDITERHHLERRLVDQAQRDPLTGLLNRAAILSKLEECVAAARGRHLSAAVLFVDLDDFKAVNDRYGHAAGDELLRRAGEAIRSCVRTEDHVGRLGGDEFVVIVPNLLAPAAAQALARRLEIELSTLMVAPGERLLSGSVGVGVLDASIADAGQLLAAADAAMYTAKRTRAAARAQN